MLSERELILLVGAAERELKFFQELERVGVSTDSVQAEVSLVRSKLIAMVKEAKDKPKEDLKLVE